MSENTANNSWDVGAVCFHGDTFECVGGGLLMLLHSDVYRVLFCIFNAVKYSATLMQFYGAVSVVASPANNCF